MSGEANQVNWRGVQPVAGIRGVWPAIDSVRVNSTVVQVDAGTTIAYTVPAGKILFLTEAVIAGVQAVVQAGLIDIHVRNVMDVLQYYVNVKYILVVDGFESRRNYFPALEVPAGFDVCITNNLDNITSFGFIYGWIEDA